MSEIRKRMSTNQTSQYPRAGINDVNFAFSFKFLADTVVVVHAGSRSILKLQQ